MNCKHKDVYKDMNFWVNGIIAGLDYSEMFSPKICSHCKKRVKHKDNKKVEYVRF